MVSMYYKDEHVNVDDTRKLAREYRALKADCEKLINDSLSMLFSNSNGFGGEIDEESAILLAKCNNLMVRSFRVMDSLAESIEESAKNNEILDKKIDIVIDYLEKLEKKNK